MSDHSISSTLRLLQAAFAEDEFAFLLTNDVFQMQLSQDDGTMENFERLVQLGTDLIRRPTGDYLDSKVP